MYFTAKYNYYDVAMATRSVPLFISLLTKNCCFSLGYAKKKIIFLRGRRQYGDDWV